MSKRAAATIQPELGPLMNRVQSVVNPFYRRRAYYGRCQDMVDFIHETIKDEGGVPHDIVVDKFGEPAFKALLHEMDRLNGPSAGNNFDAIAEWMHQTQHFTHLAHRENRDSLTFWISIFAIVLSGASFFRSLMQ